MPVLGDRHPPFWVIAMRRFVRSRWSEIRSLDEGGISEVPYDQVENVALTRTFLADRERYLERLFSNDE